MRFQYKQPRSLQDVLSLVDQHSSSAKVMAGGTDMLVAMKMERLSVPVIIGLSRVSELAGAGYDASSRSLRIGALATHHELSSNPQVLRRFSLLAEASSSVGSRQVRNVGTVVGNICNASPSADTAPALLTLEGMVNISSQNSTRQVPIAQFFVGPGKTALHQDEIVTELIVPEPEPNTFGTYIKLSRRRAMDLAIVGVAVLLTMDGAVCRKARIALGAVAPTPIRVPQAEAVLSGREANESLLEETAQAAMEICRPISDVRGSAEYRRDMVRVLVKRGIKQCLTRAAN